MANRSYPMRAITLTQPWASLVAEGVKTVETRSWSTPYRGWLAIHAAKGWDSLDRMYAAQLINRGTLRGFEDCHALPFGAVIAVARLVDVVPTEEVRDDPTVLAEREFGDYSHGRFAWLLSGIEPIDPVPARGSLGLWGWVGPTAIAKGKWACPPRP